jgi:pimeloyl-ACP methyl ester carboxylesterase
VATLAARCRLVQLHLVDGSVLCRLYEATGADAAVLWLGGVGGGFDSPARGLYDRLAVELMTRGISSLRLRYRAANQLETSVEDALVGLEFLGQRGVRGVGLVGHSFGGAVAIQAAVTSPLARGVVALASQSYGTSVVDQLAPRSLLLVHGERDAVLPVECSRYIFQRARQPKRLVVLPGTGHTLDEAADELRLLLSDWLVQSLREDRPRQDGRAARRRRSA